MTGCTLADLAWPDVAARSARSLLVLALGATEQHGHHLPIGTDTLVAGELAGELARRRSDVVLAPPLAYGASGEHAGFPGTLSIGTEATAAVLVELVRSADAFRGVVLVNGHGGNVDAVASACEQARAEGRSVLAWSPAAAVSAGAEQAGGPADAHAGWVETSMVLAVAPALVRVADAVAGDVRPLHAVMPDLRERGVGGVSPNGVLGDPSGASAAAGQALLQACVADLLAAVTDRFGPPPDQPAAHRGSQPGA